MSNTPILSHLPRHRLTHLRKPWLAALLSAGLLGACQTPPSSPGAAATSAPRPVPLATVPIAVPPQTGGTPAAEFDQARQKWQAADLRDYQFTLRQFCFCPSEEHIRVVVKNRQVAQAQFLPSGKPVGAERLQRLPSMDAIFETIAQAYAKPVDQIQLTLDPRWGYPQRVFIDYNVRIADEELIYQISDLAE